MSDPFEKRVDESWKEQVEKERRGPAQSAPPPSQQRQPERGPARQKGAPAGTEFSVFLSSLSMQAMVALGEVAHPATGLAQEDLEQARYLIDVLGLLQEKTQGNLTPEEGELLEGALYELRMKYVSKTQGVPRR